MDESAQPPAPIRVRFGLAARLALGLLTGTFVFFLLFGWAHQSLEQRHLESLVRLSANRITDIIRSSAWQHMLADDRPALYALIDSIGREPGIRRLRLMNEGGLITQSTERSEIGHQVDRRGELCVVCHEAPEPLAVLDPKSRTRIFRDPQGHRTLGVILPIENKPDCWTAACHVHPQSRRILGVIDVQLALEDVDAQLAEHRSQLVIFMSGGAALLVGIGMLFVWQFVHRPIRVLTRGTARLAAGDLHHRIPIHSPDEIGVLADSFNHMTAELAQAQSELKEWGATLERRVEEKTAALERAHRGLVRSEKMASLGRLAATVAHEVNNPLFGMLTYARLTLKDLARLEGDPKVQERMAESLGVIERESMRCGDLMKSLLAFSRQSPIKKASFSLNEVVDRAAALVRHKLELQQIELRLDLAPDLPPIDGDSNQIQQILIALLVNASEAIDKDGWVSVTTSARPDGVRLTVADNGPGIPEGIQAQIFEPFFTTKESQHRTGLGLAVAKDIVERHGGSIVLRSNPGAGAVFEIDLPWEAPTEPAGASPATTSYAQGDSSCPKV